MARLRKVVTLCLFLWVVAGCYYTVPPTGARTQMPLVRVRLTGVGPVVTVNSPQGLKLVCGSDHRSVAAEVPVRIAAANGLQVTVAGKTWQRLTPPLVCEPAAGGRIRVGNRTYRGQLRVFPAADQGLVVVNVVGLEEYLYGVVPCEIGPITPATLAAAKAQAVAARSFTLARLAKRKGLDYQLSDSYLQDQEYQGAGRETELARKAVDATSGEVLYYHGVVAEALYHGNCGGVTADGPQPFLRSVPDTPGHRPRAKPFCAGSENFTWKTTLPRDSLERTVARLGRTGFDRVPVRRCRLFRDRPGHRVVQLEFQTNKGVYRLSGADFRFALGLKSQWFEMQLHHSSVTFVGRGWGHGMGLCQDGAVAMARQGYNYRQILNHYYPGVVLKRAY